MIKKRCFSCIRCLTNPSFFSVDATQIGPKKRKVRHLNELDRNPEDRQVLGQGSKFKDYVFLSEKKERDEVGNLLAGTMSMEEFIGSTDVITENGRMLQSVLRRVEEDSPFRLPKPYQRLLEEVSKPSLVVGIMQVEKEEMLNILKRFCEGTLDIREAENRQQLYLLISEVPSFWDILITSTFFRVMLSIK